MRSLSHPLSLSFPVPPSTPLVLASVVPSVRPCFTNAAAAFGERGGSTAFDRNLITFMKLDGGPLALIVAYQRSPFSLRGQPPQKCVTAFSQSSLRILFLQLLLLLLLFPKTRFVFRVCACACVRVQRYGGRSFVGLYYGRRLRRARNSNNYNVFTADTKSVHKECGPFVNCRLTAISVTVRRTNTHVRTRLVEINILNNFFKMPRPLPSLYFCSFTILAIIAKCFNIVILDLEEI